MTIRHALQVLKGVLEAKENERMLLVVKYIKVQRVTINDKGIIKFSILSVGL